MSANARAKPFDLRDQSIAGHTVEVSIHSVVVSTLVLSAAVKRAPTRTKVGTPNNRVDPRTAPQRAACGASVATERQAAASFDLDLNEHKFVGAWIDDVVLNAQWTCISLSKRQFTFNVSR
jgi:hypothetical protein